MEKTGTGLILIILGLIVLAFPLLGVIPLGLITGFIVLFLGIGLLIGGIARLGEEAVMGIVMLVLGIIALILGLGLIVNPGLFSWLLGFMVWMVGLFLLIAGIIGLLSKSGGSRWNGILAIVIGLIYIALGTWLKDPIILGILIGVWLLINGILMLFVKE